MKSPYCITEQQLKIHDFRSLNIDFKLIRGNLMYLVPPIESATYYVTPTKKF